MDEPFDGRKLFIVEIEQSIMVLALNEEEAEEIAIDEAGCGGGIEWMNANYSAYEGFAAGWENATPFGDMGLTCASIRAAWEEYERRRSLTKAELEAAGQFPLIGETA